MSSEENDKLVDELFDYLADMGASISDVMLGCGGRWVVGIELPEHYQHLMNNRGRNLTRLGA